MTGPADQPGDAPPMTRGEAIELVQAVVAAPGDERTAAVITASRALSYRRVVGLTDDQAVALSNIHLAMELYDWDKERQRGSPETLNEEGLLAELEAYLPTLRGF